MADILVFPVVGVLFWFAWATLMSAYNLINLDIGNFLDTNVVGAWTPGIIGASIGDGGMSGMIFLAISFGMIVLIPKVPDMLKGMLLGEKFSFGMAMGEATGVLKTGWGMTGQPIVRGVQEKVGKTVADQRAQRVVDWINKIIPGKKVS